jgi:multidrug efflux pump subunit AcrA (membrane-fusion protein)
VITATNAGQVQDIAYADGAFVPANSTIATVQEAGTMYVAADFLLSAKDYARIPAQAELQIVLPNNQKITAAVSEIKVSTENGEARTIIKAYSDELANGTGLFAVGTPVESTLILTNDGIVTDVTNTVTGWFGVQA